jgi:hypothetical protein
MATPAYRTERVAVWRFVTLLAIRTWNSVTPSVLTISSEATDPVRRVGVRDDPQWGDEAEQRHEEQHDRVQQREDGVRPVPQYGETRLALDPCTDGNRRDAVDQAGRDQEAHGVDREDVRYAAEVSKRARYRRARRRLRVRR